MLNDAFAFAILFSFTGGWILLMFFIWWSIRRPGNQLIQETQERKLQ